MRPVFDRLGDALGGRLRFARLAIVPHKITMSGQTVGEQIFGKSLSVAPFDFCARYLQRLRGKMGSDPNWFVGFDARGREINCISNPLFLTRMAVAIQ